MFSKINFRGELSRGALGSLVVKIGGAILGLVVAVVLARGLGPEGYGVYSYVFSLISLLAIPAQLGLPNLIVRETAKAHAHARWGLIRGLWRWSTLVVGGVSLALMFVAALLGWAFHHRFDATHISTFAYGFALVPLVALGNMRGAALRGIRRVILGQLPELIFRPSLFVLLLLGVMILPGNIILTASSAMGLHALAACVAFMIGAVMLWHCRPEELCDRPLPNYEVRSWMKSTLPFAIVAGTMVVYQNTDILMLGLFQDAEVVGVYRVSSSVAMLVSFGLQAVTMAVSPHFAFLHASGDLVRLQRVVTLSTRAIVLFALPIVILIILFGEWFLNFVFGSEYAGGYISLTILAAGQLFSAVMGAVGILLTMTGHENTIARLAAIVALINVMLNVIFIPYFGMNGAALATVLSLAVWNILLKRAVDRNLGINVMEFDFMKIFRRK